MTTKITLERTQSIIDAAVMADLAELPTTDDDPYTLAPPEGEAGRVGRRQAPALTTDQADAVEAFIAERAGR